MGRHSLRDADDHAVSGELSGLSAGGRHDRQLMEAPTEVLTVPVELALAPRVAAPVPVSRYDRSPHTMRRVIEGLRRL